MTKQKFELTYEDAIKALDCCCSLDNKCKQCPVYVVGGTCCSSSVLAHFVRKFIEHQRAKIERLEKFKYYFDDLYGQGYEIANWHMNGDLEPFDNFYDSAIEEMDK